MEGGGARYSAPCLPGSSLSRRMGPPPLWPRLWMVSFTLLVLRMGGGPAGRGGGLVMAQCHNKCSGHGECNVGGLCDCYAGYFGAWCQQRKCPYGTAWVDFPSATDVAHGLAECSNMGYCDYKTGICKCADGFVGPSCNRMECPNRCSGHGQCLTLAEAASTFDGYMLNRSVTYNDWDADMIRGCVCDPGFVGYDCSLRPCDVGPDPRTAMGASEKKTLVCQCGPQCDGYFRLSLGGRMSATISPNATNATVASAVLGLLDVYTFKDQDARYTIDVQVKGSQVCGTGSEVETDITFKTHDGIMPPMSIFSSLDATTVSIYMQTTQMLNCSCNFGCSGYVMLSFDGADTLELPSTSSSTAIENALYNLPTLKNVYSITVTPLGSVDMLCRQFAGQSAMQVVIKAQLGNLPDLKVVSSLREYGAVGGNVTVTSNRGSKHLHYCNLIGKCNFNTGLCKCPTHYKFDARHGPCGVLSIPSSHWSGIETCPGMVDQNLQEIDSSTGKVMYFTNQYRVINNVTTSGVYMQTLGLKQTPAMVLNLTGLIPGALALDLSERMIYYVDKRHKQIGRQSLDLLQLLTSNSTFYYDFNSSANAFVSNLTVAPTDLTLDLRFGYRYAYFPVPGTYSNSLDGKIMKANLDGGVTVETIVSNLDYPTGVALDLMYDKLYFTEGRNRTWGKVYRCNLDGTNIETVASMKYNLTQPYGIALDLLIRRAFVVDQDPSGKGYIISFDMDSNSTGVNATKYHTVAASDYARGVVNGSTVTTLYTKREPLAKPEHLILDVTAQEIYYSDSDSNVIRKVNYDGTRASNVVTGTMFHPVGLAIDFGHGYPLDQEYYECHGHGHCTGFAGQYQCECFDGYSGNCDIVSCPVGKAWFDTPVDSKLAHRTAVCSNRGICDQTTGTCICQDGFEGPACDRLSCPGLKGEACSGHGQCLSMSELAIYGSLDNGNPSYFSYGLDASNSSLWDADMLHGCLCDEFGYSGRERRTKLRSYTGYDCARRECAKGDNTGTRPANTSALEVQTISCWALRGTFTLSFRGKTTRVLPHNATLDTVVEALESLPTLGRIQATTASFSPFLCSDSEVAVTNITYMSEIGVVPLLQYNMTDLWGFIEVTRLRNGTKDTHACSDHGTCDTAMGFCQCMPGYSSSNYAGDVGIWGDCGYNGARSTRFVKKATSTSDA